MTEAGPDADPAALLELALAAARHGADTALQWAQRLDQLTVETKSSASDLVSDADRATEAAIRDLLAAARPGDGFLGEETGASGRAGSGVTWVVDPIDGTTNYLYGADQWAVSVAAVATAPPGPDGAPALGDVLAGVVVEPATGRVSAAARGHGTTLDGAPARVRGAATLGTALVEFELGRRGCRQRVGDLVAALVPAVADVRRRATAASSLAAVATGRLDGFWAPSLRSWDMAAGWLLVAEAGGTTGDLLGPRAGLPADRGACLAAGPDVFEPLRDLLRQVYDDRSGPPVSTR